MFVSKALNFVAYVRAENLIPFEWNFMYITFLQAFKRAKEAADAELAQQKTPLKLASEEEVCRVLAAKTDWECLQVWELQQYAVMQYIVHCIFCVDSQPWYYGPPQRSLATLHLLQFNNRSA